MGGWIYRRTGIERDMFQFFLLYHIYWGCHKCRHEYNVRHSYIVRALNTQWFSNKQIWIMRTRAISSRIIYVRKKIGKLIEENFEAKHRKCKLFQIQIMNTYTFLASNIFESAYDFDHFGNTNVICYLGVLIIQYMNSAIIHRVMLHILYTGYNSPFWFHLKYGV